jgi:hypothetical protein
MKNLDLLVDLVNMDIKGNSNFQESETKVKNFVVAVVDCFCVG